MSTAAAILVLLSFVAAIAAWVVVAKRLREKGKGGFIRHLAGAAASFIAWAVMIVVAAIVDSPSQPANNPNTQAAATSASAPAASAPPAAVPVAASQIAEASEPVAVSEPKAEEKEQTATLDLDFATFRRRCNTDFAATELPFKITPSSKPFLAVPNAVQKTSKIMLDDNLGIILSADPKTDKLTSIMVILGASTDAMSNLKNGVAAALILSSAEGDNGNTVVGNKIISLIKEVGDEFNNGDKATVSDSFIHNNIKYSASISRGLPFFMLSAAPIK